MKKILYTLLSGVMALASCSKEAAEELAPQTESTTFTLTVDQLQTPAQAKAATRATSTVTPTRYVMEVWSEDGTQPENVFENGTTNHAEITTGSSFTVTLDKTKAYTCLFWADDNATYDAASLKAIALNSDKGAYTEAYHAKILVPNGKNPAVTVTLTRAVAKITLTETAAVKTSDNLALSFTNIYPAFNVFEGTATGTAATWTKTVKPGATTATIGTLYFFAKPTKELTEFTFTYASEAPKTVSNVPYQQNFATNVKGEYSAYGSFTFIVTADNDWETTENNVVFPKGYKVGDVYPDASAPIGVVFWIDETDASYNSTYKTSAKGKIVSLDEADGRWGADSKDESIDVIGIRDANNGAAATKNLITARLGSDSFAMDYYVFNWIYETKNGNDVNGRWYLPAKNELQHLYCAYIGVPPTTWDGDTAPEDIAGKKAAFNDVLTSAGGDPFSVNFYRSSTEVDSTQALDIYFLGGATFSSSKNDNKDLVRAVLAF